MKFQSRKNIKPFASTSGQDSNKPSFENEPGEVMKHLLSQGSSKAGPGKDKSWAAWRFMNAFKDLPPERAKSDTKLHPANPKPTSPKRAPPKVHHDGHTKHGSTHRCPRDCHGLVQDVTPLPEFKVFFDVVPYVDEEQPILQQVDVPIHHGAMGQILPVGQLLPAGHLIPVNQPPQLIPIQPAGPMGPPPRSGGMYNLHLQNPWQYSFPVHGGLWDHSGDNRMYSERIDKDNAKKLTKWLDLVFNSDQSTLENVKAFAMCAMNTSESMKTCVDDCPYPEILPGMTSFHDLSEMKTEQLLQMLECLKIAFKPRSSTPCPTAPPTIETPFEPTITEPLEPVYSDTPEVVSPTETIAPTSVAPRETFPPVIITPTPITVNCCVPEDYDDRGLLGILFDRFNCCDIRPPLNLHLHLHTLGRKGIRLFPKGKTCPPGTECPPGQIPPGPNPPDQISPGQIPPRFLP